MSYTKELDLLLALCVTKITVDEIILTGTYGLMILTISREKEPVSIGVVQTF
jgi:hypothetical protein